MTKRVWKQPSESRWFTYDFSDLLAGRTIQSFTSATATERDDATKHLAQVGAPIQSPTAIQVEWSGGADGETYVTEVRVLDTQNEVHELNGDIAIFEIQSVLPTNISTAYLTAEEYVDRFGFEETVRLTDQDRTGTINGPTLQKALNDATELVSSYLGVRYTLPLSPIPELVKGLVADLARERLYSQRPTAAVTQAGDRARTMLKDLSGGRMALPDQTGVGLPVTSGGSARSGGDRLEADVFCAAKLDRFPSW